MSDVFYAVQFRSMHTAIHNIAVFSLENKAEELFHILNTTEQMPDEHEFEFEPSNFVDMYEIDFRNPPQHHNDDLRLIYVNNPVNTIPDVYGY